MDTPLTESQRYPSLTMAGRKLLKRLQEHPHAPRYNHHCGDRLDARALRRIRKYELELRRVEPAANPGAIPAWVRRFARICLAEVPFYRRRGGSAEKFAELPTVTRADLGREPWSFVPDSQSLDNLIVYSTSGTTGHPLSILSHPEVSSGNLPLLRAALRRHGVTLKGGPGKVALILVCMQKTTFVFASVSTYLGQAGFVKVNLNPSEWNDPRDRAGFLEDCSPEVYTGDPISFLELSKLRLKKRPKALISTALALLPELRRKLEKHFRCPVLDLYAMNETGPIAVAVERGHELIGGDVFVEILDADGKTCAPGTRGEVVITCARNPFLPLLRYRTGDWAALEHRRGKRVLVGLEGRPPVVFRAVDGRMVNNIDVTIALRNFPISQFKLHQEKNGGLVYHHREGEVPMDRIRAALADLFGAEQKFRFEPISESETRGGKIVQYTSEL